MTLTVDPTASSGEANRWIGNVTGQAVAYPGRDRAGPGLLLWTSEPLAGDTHVLGFPVMALRLATTGTDGAVFVYLEEVGPAGRVAYLTEGQLRLTHRVTDAPAAPTGLGVPRGFRRDGRLAVRPGEWLDLVVELFPVSALIPAGHRLRVAVGGHDAACFARYGPDGERFTVALGEGSYLDLPVMPAG